MTAIKEREIHMMIDSSPTINRILNTLESQQQNLKTIEGRVIQIEKQLEDHSKRFARIEKKLEEHDQRLARIEKKLEEHDQRFARIEKKLEEHDERLTRIEIRLKEIERRFDLLEEKFETFKDTIYTKLDNIFEILTRWEDEKTLTNARLEQHEARITFLEKQSLSS